MRPGRAPAECSRPARRSRFCSRAAGAAITRVHRRPRHRPRPARPRPARRRRPPRRMRRRPPRLDANQQYNPIPFNVGEVAGLPNGWSVQVAKVTRPFVAAGLAAAPAGQQYVGVSMKMVNLGLATVTVNAAKIFTIVDNANAQHAVVAGPRQAERAGRRLRVRRDSHRAVGLRRPRRPPAAHASRRPGDRHAAHGVPDRPAEDAPARLTA